MQEDKRIIWVRIRNGTLNDRKNSGVKEKIMKKNLMKKMLAGILVFSSLVLTACGSEKSEEGSSSVAAVSDAGGNASGGQEAFSSNEKNYAGLTIHLGDLNAGYIIKLADGLGFLKEEFEPDGIKVEYSNFSSGTELVEAMATKDEDFGYSGMLPIISAIASGQNIKIVSSVQWTQEGFAVIANPERNINKLEDLKGKSIAMMGGTNENQAALQFLDYVGLTENDVELVNVKDRLTPLLNGDVDAAVLSGAILPTAINAGYKKIADCSDIGVTFSNSFIVRGEFGEQYPELVSRLLKVMDKTVNYVYANEKEALTVFSEITGTDYDVSKQSWDLWHYGVTVDEATFSKPILDAYNFLVSTDTVPEGLDVNSFFTAEYFNAIQ